MHHQLWHLDQAGVIMVFGKGDFGDIEGLFKHIK